MHELISRKITRQIESVERTAIYFMYNNMLGCRCISDIDSSLHDRYFRFETFERIRPTLKLYGWKKNYVQLFLYDTTDIKNYLKKQLLIEKLKTA